MEIETAPLQFEKRYVKQVCRDGINIEVLEGVKKGDKLKLPPMAG